VCGGALAVLQAIPGPHANWGFRCQVAAHAASGSRALIGAELMTEPELRARLEREGKLAQRSLSPRSSPQTVRRSPGLQSAVASRHTSGGADDAAAAAAAAAAAPPVLLETVGPRTHSVTRVAVVPLMLVNSLGDTSMTDPVLGAPERASEKVEPRSLAPPSLQVSESLSLEPEEAPSLDASSSSAAASAGQSIDQAPLSAAAVDGPFAGSRQEEPEAQPTLGESVDLSQLDVALLLESTHGGMTIADEDITMV
jgi:hypothetical protein